jgi:hypothetical protein
MILEAEEYRSIETKDRNGPFFFYPEAEGERSLLLRANRRQTIVQNGMSHR